MRIAMSIGVVLSLAACTASNPHDQFNAARVRGLCELAHSCKLAPSAASRCSGGQLAPGAVAHADAGQPTPVGAMAIVRRVAEQLPIAVLVSGTGTNLQALLDTVHEREAQIVAVASSTADAPALQRAAARDVPTAVFARGDYRRPRARATRRWPTGCSRRGARLVVLAGYMELLGAAFLARFPDAVINVHPSLLPAFPGIDAIGDALAYGVQVFGVTVHFVDDGIDTGPVILQRAIELADAREKSEVLSALRPLEHALLAQAVRLFARGALRIDAADPRHPLGAPARDASADWPDGPARSARGGRFARPDEALGAGDG